MSKPISSLRQRAKIAQAWVHHMRYKLFPTPLQHFEGMRFQSYQFTHGTPTTAQTTASSIIAPIIWTYWTGGPVPDFVAACIASWKRYNPTFTIHILNDETLPQFLEEIPTTLQQHSPAKRSDWVRLALLQRYGGIWLDASTILTAPLQWVMDEQQQTQADFVGFYIENFTSHAQYPVVESWFMAAPANSPFISDALHEFEAQVLPRTGKEYVAYLQELGIYPTLAQKIYGTEYLSIHLAMQRVIQFGAQAYRLQLARAESGPFFYQASENWSRHAFRAKLTTSECNGAVPPLIKLRNADRRGLIMCIDNDLTTPHSLVNRYLPLKKA